VTLLSAIGDAVKGKAATLSNAAIANMEEARGVASSAKDLAGEATSLVKVCARGRLLLLLVAAPQDYVLPASFGPQLEVSWTSHCPLSLLSLCCPSPRTAGTVFWNLRQEVLGAVLLSYRVPTEPLEIALHRAGPLAPLHHCMGFG